MDHKFITEVDLVDRYLMGRLAPEEAVAFEEHFVDCQECVGRLNTTKALMDGLRIVLSDQALAPREPRRLVWPLLRPSIRRSLALAAGILLLVASFAAVYIQIRRSRAEAAQARLASAEWQHRYEEERATSSLAEMKHQDSARELTAKAAQIRAELENQRKQNAADAAGYRAALRTPQINFKTFLLSSTRGEPSAGTANEIVVPRSPTNFAISVSLEGERHKAYAMTIVDKRHRRIWKRRGLPDSDALSARFISTFFLDGDYTLTVEGLAGDGRRSVVGEYPFRVRKTP